jgi:archaellum component FlaC
MELHERVKEIKMKVLDVSESRVTNDASLEELQQITFALNNIDEDKNFFAKTFAGISSLGFNGSSSKIPEAKTEETK